MTLRELPKDVVLRSLAATADERCRHAQQLLIADERSSFTITDEPAALLRESLEMKYRIAKGAGRRIDGDAELLLSLADLGEEPVTGVFTQSRGEHANVYFRSSTLQVIGCVLMGKAGAP